MITNDNSNAGLSILETDGLFQKEKANRLGNKIFTFTARYKDYNEMHNTYNNRLGAVYGDDIVIYHRDTLFMKTAWMRPLSALMIM